MDLSNPKPNEKPGQTPTVDMDNPLLESALACARRGWSVFPVHTIVDDRCSCGSPNCDSPAKHPRTRNGFHDASTNEVTIRAWWDRWPDANVGVATGAVSGLVVLDVDAAHGGRDSLEDLVADHGDLPDTVLALTGGGGAHYLFLHPGRPVKSRTGIAPGIDVRADGGYIVVEPSLHASGRRYAWELSSHPDEVGLADVPKWLLGLIDGPNGKATTTTDRPGFIPEGQRNDRLASLAGSMRRRGMSESAIRAALLEENQHRSNPPLAEAEVGHIAHSISRYAPAEDDSAHDTELGLSQRIVTQHGHDLRFCFPWNTWLVWDGTRWATDRAGEVWNRGKEVVRGLYQEALAEQDLDARKKRLGYALRCEKESFLRAAVSLARSDVAVRPEELNRDPWLLNTPSGTLDLRTGALHPHQRERLMTKLCPTPYDPGGACPGFERFLLQIMDQNLELAFYLQRVLGYAITGTAKEHVLFLLIGPGGNGKSTLTGVMNDVLGSDYAVQVAPSLLFRDRKDVHPTSIADLYGKRFAVTHELDGGTRLAEGLVKQLTGGDRIKARRMHQDFWEFSPSHTLFLCANTKPVIRGSDDGIWRRIRLIPFRVQIPEAEQDRDLPEKLRGEAAGILSWIVQGAMQWMATGLCDPDDVRAATEQYRSESDVVGEFLAARCTTGVRGREEAKALYEAYSEWHQDAVGGDPISQRAFGQALSDRGFTRRRGGSGRYQWQGLELN